MKKTALLLLVVAAMTANAQEFVKPKQIALTTISEYGKESSVKYHEQSLPLTSELVSYVEKVEFSKDASENCWATETIETKYITRSETFTNTKKVICPPSK